MKFPNPVKAHSGLKPIVTQEYGSTTMLEWYKARNIPIPFHNGIDIVLNGTNQQNYGTELVASFDGAIQQKYWDEPMSSKGNGVDVRSKPFINEKGEKVYILCKYWHCSEVSPKWEVSKGDTVAYMGNSGMVNPPPSLQDCFAGSHLHFMVYEYKDKGNGWELQNKDNGVGGAINPRLYFDFDIVNFQGIDTGDTKDTPPLMWFVNKLHELLKLLNIWKIQK